MSEIEEALIKAVSRYRWNPLRYAHFAWEWGSGELAGIDAPRQWQQDTLAAIRDHLSDEATRYTPLQMAVASGHGIGKSALIGIIVQWALSTCPNARVVVTANTDTQLRTKTGPEVGKWFRLAINRHWWEVTATAIYSTDKLVEKSWRADFIPWSENNTEAFAGLHNQGKRIVVVMDEGSAVSDKIYEVIEGALTDENTEIIWLVFGNPTRSSGRFRECFRNMKHRWHQRQIDSRTVEGTNKQQIAKWVEDYGENSDFVKVRVRGLFPNLSVRQFISEADVDAAFGKHLRPEQYKFAPVIIGVDPAWTGEDSFEIWLRQGLMSKCLGSYPKNDNDFEMAAIIARFEDEHNADAVFVDGGFGTGVISGGRTLGRNWQIVWFGGKSGNPGCKNKRSEMWTELRDWLKAGGAIPPDNGLRDELTGIEAVPHMEGMIQLESKESLKARGLPSPNKADALALTFAFPVVKKSPLVGGGHNPRTVDYNPFSKL